MDGTAASARTGPARPGVLAPLSVVAYRRLWVAGTLSKTGDMLLLFAVPFFVFSRTGSALATGGALAAEMLPAVVLAPVAGVFVDRWDRRLVLVASDIVRAVILGAFVLMGGEERLWLVFVMLGLQSAVTQFFAPARDALLPSLLPAAQLVAANALMLLTDDVLRLTAPALGGVLLAAGGITPLVLIDAATFVVSAVLVLAIPSSLLPVRETVPRTGGALRAVAADVAEGLRYVRRAPGVAAMFALLVATAVAAGGYATLLPGYVRDVLDRSAEHFGVLMAAFGAGGIAGGLLAGQWAARWPPRRTSFCSLVTVGAATVAMAQTRNLMLVVLLQLASGGAIVVGSIVLRTLLQTCVDDRVRGRVFASLGALTSAATLVGAGAGGLAGDMLGLRVALSAAGAVLVLAGTLAFRLPHRIDLGDDAT